MDWWRALLDLFFPRTCPVCGRPLLRREAPVCIYCLSDLPQTRFWLLPRNPMADKFNALLERRLSARESGASADEAASSPAWEPYVYASALFFYNGRAGYRLLPQRLKYHADFQVGRYFGALLGQRLAESSYLPALSAVIPVPLHWTRRWRRGYNQAAVLAGAIARELGCPLEASLLRRCRRTRTQTRLSVADKARNVAGAFRADVRVLRRLLAAAAASSSASGASLSGASASASSASGASLSVASASASSASGDSLSGAVGPQVHLLLVDDVFTTGATLLGCYAALREALAALGVPPGAVRISLATLAFVGNT